MLRAHLSTFVKTKRKEMEMNTCFGDCRSLDLYQMVSIHRSWAHQHAAREASRAPFRSKLRLGEVNQSHLEVDFTLI